MSEYVLNYLEKRYNMDKKKLIVNSKENVSQRRKDYMKMLLNQYEKIRRIYTEEDYIGSRTEALVSHECSRFLSSRPKAFSRRNIKARALYHTFFANYGKDREKAYELYFSGKRTSSLEKAIEMECLPEIVNETGKSTNMPYLRG